MLNMYSNLHKIFASLARLPCRLYILLHGLNMAASQTPYQLQATAPLGCAGSGLPSLGLPVLLPNYGVLVVLQDSVQ